MRQDNETQSHLSGGHLEKSSWGRTKVIAGLSALVVAVPLASPAHATHYDFQNLVPTAVYAPTCINDVASADGPVCRTDNNTLTWFADRTGPSFELETSDFNVIVNVMDTDYETSDTGLSVSNTTSPSYSGGTETDIIYQESNQSIPSNLDGMTWCDDAVDGTSHECDQQYVRIRDSGHYVGPWPPILDTRFGYAATESVDAVKVFS
ncbi:MAG: hypothetical protein ACT4QF_20935 [Sporichthyaceae bacterium]